MLELKMNIYKKNSSDEDVVKCLSISLMFVEILLKKLLFANELRSESDLLMFFNKRLDIS